MKKTISLAVLLGLAAPHMQAQSVAPRPSSRPLMVSVFSESVSLPGFTGIVPVHNPGVRIGTEFYYRNRPNTQVFQTLNLGYYRHASLHHGLYLSTEFGYRKFIGPVFLDGTIGGGYLNLTSRLPVYTPTGDGQFTKASARFHKFMPTIGLGAGVRFNQRTSLLVRYEVFGEMPVVNDIPLLPHKALHVGVRIDLKK